MYSEANYGIRAFALSVLTIFNFNLFAQEPTPYWKKRKASWKENEITCMQKAMNEFKKIKVHGVETATQALADFKADNTNGLAILERMRAQYKFLDISDKEEEKHPMSIRIEQAIASYRRSTTKVAVFDDLLDSMKKFEKDGTDVSEGCFQRASALYDYLSAECPTVGQKLYFKWLKGDLELNRRITWRYHTAVAFTDKDEYIWILDPTVYVKETWHKEWKDRYNPSKGELTYDSTEAKTLSILGSQDTYPTDPKPKKLGYYNPNPGKSLQETYRSSYYASATIQRPSLQQRTSL